jgi:hypothetical protein
MMTIAWIAEISRCLLPGRAGRRAHACRCCGAVFASKFACDRHVCGESLQDRVYVGLRIAAQVLLCVLAILAITMMIGPIDKAIRSMLLSTPFA